MLISDLALVRTAHIILASASPRRSSILNEQIGLNVRTVPSTFAEDLDKSQFTSPSAYVMENARQKALEVYARAEAPFQSKHGRQPSLIIGADTVVVLGGDEILEKPSSTEEARRMLGRLVEAGSHTVQTGVALVYGGTGKQPPPEPHVHVFYEETTVNFAYLSPQEIEAYVATGEPMDKAGGYGIQGLGGVFVDSVDGDYQNVVGFPLARFRRELDTARIRDWLDAAPPEVTPDAAAVVVDAEEPGYATSIPGIDPCETEEECGLPSD